MFLHGKALFCLSLPSKDTLQQGVLKKKDLFVNSHLVSHFTEVFADYDGENLRQFSFFICLV